MENLEEKFCPYKNSCTDTRNDELCNKHYEYCRDYINGLLDEYLLYKKCGDIII